MNSVVLYETFVSVVRRRAALPRSVLRAPVGAWASVAMVMPSDGVVERSNGPAFARAKSRDATAEALPPPTTGGLRCEGGGRNVSRRGTSATPSFPGPDPHTPPFRVGYANPGFPPV